MGYRVCLFAGLLSWSATAVSTPLPNPFEVGLHLQGEDTDWRYADGTIRRTRLNSVYWSWQERFSKSMNGGAAIGYTEGTQADNPVPDARYTSGNWLEINLQYFLVDQPLIGANLSFAYRYTDLAIETTTQKANWRWHRGRLGAELSLGWTPTLHTTLGASYVALDGQEILSGTLTQITNFKQDQTLGGYLGFQLALDRAGSVSIEIQGGSYRGGKLSFARWF